MGHAVPVVRQILFFLELVAFVMIGVSVLFPARIEQ
jgi:hypothetical protein